MRFVIDKKSIETTLQSIFHNRGFDTWDYKLAHIQHKISGRMSSLNISGLLEYQEYIKSNPNEYKPLFNTILEGESLFFRDPEAWDYVRDFILPKIMQASDESKVIRIWSVGCSSGEEPYSVAIMLAETLKDDLAKYKIRIYATDIDEPALRIARSGTYIFDQLTELPEYVKEKYFICNNDLFTISNEIKHLLIFNRHNLVSDPPISNVDLLLCRNVLIYLEPLVKSRTIKKLRYALSDRGYLWLGRGETHIDSNEYGLRPSDAKWRIFKKKTTHQNYDKLHGMGPPSIIQSVSDPEESIHHFEQNITGVIILDENYRVILCNQFAHLLCFHQYSNQNHPPDTSTMTRWQHSLLIEPDQLVSFFDMDISFQIVDLKNKIKQTITNREILIIDGVEYFVSKDKQVHLRIGIIPLHKSSNQNIVIFIEDITNRYALQKKLQITIESFESTNKYLVSANKALKTMTEELEIINEYLQSKNSEEFMTINEELIERTSELESIKLHYETIINSMDCGIIIVDQNLFIRTVNYIATSKFGIKSDVINDNSLLSLKNYISLGSLVDQVIEAMKTGNSNTCDIEWEDGKREVNVSIFPMIREKAEGAVLVIKER